MEFSTRRIARWLTRMPATIRRCFWIKKATFVLKSVAEFRWEDVNPSPAFFDVKKLRAFNGEYIRALSVDQFITACQPWLRGETVPWAPEAYDESVFAAQREFIRDSRIALAMVNILFAIPHTPLHARLGKEGRLVALHDLIDGSVTTNVIPSRISRRELA